MSASQETAFYEREHPSARVRTAPLPEGILRAPPDFREELHPDEIVRRPSRHPWLATIALVVSAVALGMLLRALAPFGADAPATAHHPGALERAATRFAHDPGSTDERSTAMRTGK